MVELLKASDEMKDLLITVEHEIPEIFGEESQEQEQEQQEQEQEQQQDQDEKTDNDVEMTEVNN